MTKIALEIYDDIVTTLNKIRDINDAGIEIDIPEGSILFENILNLKLIKYQAEKYGFTVNFDTTDEIGLEMLDILEDKTTLNQTEATDDNEDVEPTKIKLASTGKNKSFSLGNIFSAIPLHHITKQVFSPQMKGPNLKATSIFPTVIGILIPALIFGYVIFQSGQRKVDVNMTVKSQPLTRSITIKVKAGTTTSPETKTLNGIKVNSSMDSTKEANATGEKIVGKKATGTVKIFNNTDSDKDFKKGAILIFSQNKKDDLNYVLTEGVTVKAAAKENPLDPESNIVPGNATVEVEASAVGAEYNIDKDSTLEVKGYKSSSFAAKAAEDFTGGKSEKVTIVTATDLTNISAALNKEITEQAATSFNSKIGRAQKLIAGSVKTTKLSETFTKKVGDEAKTVGVAQSVQTEGLTYMDSDMNRLLDALVKEYIPEGFTLSDKERQINVEVLGNSTNSVLTSDEADLQVTLKTYIIPDISEDTVKNNLMGKTPKEAEQYLGSIRNVETYEFNMGKTFVPFLNKIPKDASKITVNIERQ